MLCSYRCMLSILSVGLLLLITASPVLIKEDVPVGRRLRQRQDAAQQSAEAAGTSPQGQTPLAPGISVTYAASEGYKSQEGQDKWVNQHIFHDRRGGVFVDLGCYDGVTYSNTWFFERQLGWRGICVEPNPHVFGRIDTQAGRTSGVQAAISNRDGTAPFVTAYMRSSLNASAVDYAFLSSQGIGSETVMVQVLTPKSLLTKYLSVEGRGQGRKLEAVIDYVNIDVEAQELSILEVWPFSEVCVEVFNIENQPPNGEPSTLPRLIELLQPHGYTHLLRIGVDEVFRRTSSCGDQHHARHRRSGSHELSETAVGHGGGVLEATVATPTRTRARRKLQGRRLRRPLENRKS
jgi:FkbM family methyltransferase